jgi:hypothetical protein
LWRNVSHISFASTRQHTYLEIRVAAELIVEILSMPSLWWGPGLSAKLPFPSRKARDGKASTKSPRYRGSGSCRDCPLLGRAAFCFLSVPHTL